MAECAERHPQQKSKSSSRNGTSGRRGFPELHPAAPNLNRQPRIQTGYGLPIRRCPYPPAYNRQNRKPGILRLLSFAAPFDGCTADQLCRNLRIAIPECSLVVQKYTTGGSRRAELTRDFRGIAKGNRTENPTEKGAQFVIGRARTHSGQSSEIVSNILNVIE